MATDGEVQALVQLDDQLLHHRRDHRVEAGGGLVEEQDLRLERDGAREADAAPHAARELRRQLALGPLEAHQVEALGDPRAQALAAPSRRACSGKATLPSTVIESNSAPSWKAMPKRRRKSVSSRLRERRQVDAVDATRAGVGPHEPDHVLEHHALAGARAADDHQRLAGEHVEVDGVEHHLGRRTTC